MRVMRSKRLAALTAAAGVLAAGSAEAAIFAYTTDFSTGVGPEWTISAGVNSGAAGILGELGEGTTTATLAQSSPGASSVNGAQLSFDLLAFRSLDGVNCCTDVFSLIINGQTVFEAAFAFDGGGGEQVYTNTNGVSYAGALGKRFIFAPFTAVAGVNTFAFRYAPLQGFGDEAWGLDNVAINALVSDPPVGGIPEPSAWALMILGFGAAGAGLRSRRRLSPA